MIQRFYNNLDVPKDFQMLLFLVVILVEVRAAFLSVFEPR